MNTYSFIPVFFLLLDFWQNSIVWTLFPFCLAPIIVFCTVFLGHCSIWCLEFTMIKKFPTLQTTFCSLPYLNERRNSSVATPIRYPWNGDTNVNRNTETSSHSLWGGWTCAALACQLPSYSRKLSPGLFLPSVGQVTRDTSTKIVVSYESTWRSSDDWFPFIEMNKTSCMQASQAIRKGLD